MKGHYQRICILVALFQFLCSANPRALADTIYVTQNFNDSIAKFDSNGNESLFADASSGLSKPYGLALDSDGNLYVANSGNNTVMKFDSSGNGSIFASSGLDSPGNLAFDGHGNLYVLNAIGTIEKFDSGGHGTFFASVGLTLPQGVACDARGNLYVANAPILGAGFNRITVSKFDSSGNRSDYARLDFITHYRLVPVGTSLSLRVRDWLTLAASRLGATAHSALRMSMVRS